MRFAQLLKQCGRDKRKPGALPHRCTDKANNYYKHGFYAPVLQLHRCAQQCRSTTDCVRAMQLPSDRSQPGSNSSASSRQAGSASGPDLELQEAYNSTSFNGGAEGDEVRCPRVRATLIVTRLAPAQSLRPDAVSEKATDVELLSVVKARNICLMVRLARSV